MPGSKASFGRCCCVCLLLAVCSLVVSACSPFPSGPSHVVVLDIGHCMGAEGAATPRAVGGKVIRECSFWYEYAYYVKREIERAGYACVVSNRGRMPRTEPQRTHARRAQVQHMKRPDGTRGRYPSYYYPDRVASGIISADFAVYRKARAVVFLHHNSAGRWTSRPMPSKILYNRYNGRALAKAVADVLNRDVLNHGMPNGGRKCTLETRYVDATRAAGWLNVCDDAGIPAVVIEAAFLNNKRHAAYLADPAKARFYAESIGRGVVHYLRRGQPVRHRRVDVDAPDEGSFGYARESRRLRVRGAKKLLPYD